MPKKFNEMVEPAPHDCVECLEDDCDCGGSDLACNGCSDCYAKQRDEELNDEEDFEDA